MRDCMAALASCIILENAGSYQDVSKLAELSTYCTLRQVVVFCLLLHWLLTLLLRPLWRFFIFCRSDFPPFTMLCHPKSSRLSDF